MEYYPKSVKKVIENLSRLPGIGGKTAERLSGYILNMPYAHAESLANSIIEIKKKVRRCKLCFSLTDDEICSICSNPVRDKSIICVVEQPEDMIMLEKSNSYNGVYHILCGLLSPIDGIGPDDIRIKELIKRVENKNIKEVVLAVGTSTQGESTASFISKKFKNMNIKITRIATGIPVGGELKYIDQVTLKKAMDARYEL